MSTLNRLAAVLVFCWWWCCSSVVVGQWNDFRYLTAGKYHACVTHVSVVECWGGSSDGQQYITWDTERYGYCGRGDFGATGIYKAAAGAYHTCALYWNGAIACSGRDNHGQSSPPGPLSQKRRWEYIVAGDFHTCVLSLNKDEIKCWGLNNFGQTNPPTLLSPTALASISCGSFHCCGIDDKKYMHCWGMGKNGTMKPPSNTHFIAVSSGGNGTCGIIEGSNKLMCFGDAEGVAKKLPPPSLYNWTKISVGFHHICGIVSGTLTCFGDNKYGQLNAGRV